MCYKTSVQIVCAKYYSKILPMCVFTLQPVVLQCTYCTSVIITDTLVEHTIEITVVDEGGTNLPKPVIFLN